MRRWLPLVLALLALLACGRSRPVVLSPLDARIRDAGAAWDRYSPQDQAGIRAGIVRPGLDELALYIARGKPAFYWRTHLPNATCNVLLHEKAGEPELVDRAFFTCGGAIVQIVAVNPEVPCWRLADVAPRIAEKLPYFESKPLGQQWEIVEGILRRGQTSEDVYIAFGKPYNTGVEAREDGTNASSQVYLDSTGESYGLYITLVDGKVAGWKIPPDRQLTPEAQKKRLEATEARLMSQLKVMEQNNEKRHKEQVRLLTDLQSRADEIVKNQTAGVVGVTETTGASGPEAKLSNERRVTKSSRTMTLDDCTFNDETGDPDFMKPCEDGGCSKAYVCYAYMGTRGRCVPSAQLEACGKGSKPPPSAVGPAPATPPRPSKPPPRPKKKKK